MSQLDPNPRNRMLSALEWKHNHPNESDTTIARIFKVSRSQITRRKARALYTLGAGSGGQNVILQPYHVTAINRYVREHTTSGFYSSKSTDKSAITCRTEYDDEK